MIEINVKGTQTLLKSLISYMRPNRTDVEGMRGARNKIQSPEKKEIPTLCQVL